LLKNINDRGFTFFTNFESDKSIDIENNKNVALNFYWPELERQVRISGEAGKIKHKDSDAYFRSRPRASQLGTWLSNQSTSISLDHNFTESLTKLEARFKGKEVARPSHWGGYCIDDDKIEFWQGRPSRFHDRVLYEFDTDNWSKRRLAP
jgi:pyridoxamine 5'-phosphate oxidase